MKKMNKRLISLVLAVTMIAGVMAVGFSAFAEDDANVTYTYEVKSFDQHTKIGSDGSSEDVDHAFVKDVCRDCKATKTYEKIAVSESEFDNTYHTSIVGTYKKTEEHEFDSSGSCKQCKYKYDCSKDGHRFGTDISRYDVNGHYLQCSVCGEEQGFEHKWMIGWQQTEDKAFHYIGCEICAYQKDREYHTDFDTNYVDQDGSKISDGLCDVCKAEVDHRYRKMDRIAPTCSELGKEQYSCINCKDAYEEPIPMLGHEYTTDESSGFVTLDWADDFTRCTIIFKCTREDCNNEVKYNVYTGSGYEDNYVKLDESQGATCTESGKTTYVAQITVKDIGISGWCEGEPSKVIYKHTVDTPALGHSYTETVENTDATCTKDGVLTKKCARCESTKKETVPASGHKFVTSTVISEPTCTKVGLVEGKCSVCGETATNEISALGHSYVDYVVVKEPSCSEEGERVGTCETCGEKASEAIPATGHTFISGSSKCQLCGATKPVDCSAHTQRFDLNYNFICDYCGKDLRTIEKKDNKTYLSTYLIHYITGWPMYQLRRAINYLMGNGDISALYR